MIHVCFMQKDANHGFKQERREIFVDVSHMRLITS